LFFRGFPDRDRLLAAETTAEKIADHKRNDDAHDQNEDENGRAQIGHGI